MTFDRQEYMRKWREAHKEEILAYSKRKYLEKREVRLPQMRQYYQEHKEKEREQNRLWLAAHPNYIKEWEQRNPEKARARGKRWEKVHPDRVRAKNARRRLATKGYPGEQVDIESVWIRDRGFCGECGKFCPYESGWHLDHYLPLVAGGKHEMGNVRVTCAPCNLKKGKKVPR